jgi:hypothetical protein
MLKRTSAVLLFAMTAASLACNGGGAGDGTPAASATPIEGGTPTPAVTSTAVGGTHTPPPDIRGQDLTEEPALSDYLASSGGTVDAARITYADLTEDGVEDAVVPVSSGGEGGDIAVFVYGYGPAGLQELLMLRPEAESLRAEVFDGALTVSEPVYAPGDPFCCPSQLRTRTYGWDGTKLVVVDEATEPAGEN